MNRTGLFDAVGAMKARRVLAVVCIIVSFALVTSLPWGVVSPYRDVDIEEIPGLWVAGLAGAFFSARWYMKLSGRTHKVNSQTIVAILFWYSLLRILQGLFMILMASLTQFEMFDLWSALIGVVILALIAIPSWIWRKRLRAAEKIVQGSAQANAV